MTKGTFITFEGGEGSGKTTLIQRLQKHLEDQGFQVLVTREPGGSYLSEQVRNWLLDKNSKITPVAELLLFLAARVQHIEEKIKPAIDEGKVVLCDRFNDSTVVYQGVARQLGMHRVKRLCNEVTQDAQPTLTLLLDIDPVKGLQRATGTPDRMENETVDFHKLVQKGYQALAEQESQRICTIDASKPVDEVFAEAVKIIQKQLLKHV